MWKGDEGCDAGCGVACRMDGEGFALVMRAISYGMGH